MLRPQGKHNRFYSLAGKMWRPCLIFGQYKIWTADYGLRTTDYGLRTTDYGLRTTDYGLGIKHGLRYKTRTKHYGLGIKYGLGYEQAHSGCKLHPLSVLRAKATSSTSGHRNIGTFSIPVLQLNYLFTVLVLTPHYTRFQCYVHRRHLSTCHLSTCYVSGREGHLVASTGNRR